MARLGLQTGVVADRQTNKHLNRDRDPLPPRRSLTPLRLMRGSARAPLRAAVSLVASSCRFRLPVLPCATMPLLAPVLCTPVGGQPRGARDRHFHVFDLHVLFYQVRGFHVEHL